MERTLSGPEASDALNDTGWRYLLDSLRTSVPARSLAEGVELAARAATACGEHADGHLQADVRRGQVLLTLQSPAEAAVTTRDIDLAHRISAAVRAAGSRTEPGAESEATRTVQLLEIAIDALDPAAVRPFWKAVLGYADAPGASGPAAPLADPVGQGPALWFQRMDRARPQRNRLHLDICVPHDEAPRRIEAALAAGGRLLSATRGAGVLGARRRRGQRGLRHHLAGAGLTRRTAGGRGTGGAAPGRGAGAGGGTPGRPGPAPRVPAPRPRPTR